MPDVFVLGSGFSKAIHELMPTLRELGDEVRRALDQERRGLPDSVLRLGNNVEFWLTYLSQPHPWLKEYENLDNRALMLRITEKIGHILNERENEVIGAKIPYWEKMPEWLKPLLESWGRRQPGSDEKTTVITFNYDTLVERAAWGVNSNWEPGNLYRVPLTEAGVRTGKARRGKFGDTTDDVEYDLREEDDQFRLLKLHGSVNWWYSGAASFQGEELLYTLVAPWLVPAPGEPHAAKDHAASTREGLSREAASDKVPLIVPPTTEKAAFFQHETLRRIWFEAAEALRKTTHVYCIGYSLPPTDLAVRFFLQSAAPSGRIPLYVVNTQQESVCHYRDLLGAAYEVLDKYVGPHAVQAMVEDLMAR